MRHEEHTPGEQRNEKSLTPRDPAGTDSVSPAFLEGMEHTHSVQPREAGSSLTRIPQQPGELPHY